MSIFLYRCIGRLPFPLLYGFSWMAYLAIYYLAGYRKAVVKDNLAQAFPEKTEIERTFLVKKFYRQLADTAAEIAKARYMTAQQLKERVQLLNPEVLMQSSQDLTRPVIVLTIHQGNWEWMLHGISLALDTPLDPVYKPLHQESADRFIREIRSRFGSRPLPMAKASRDILRRRREFRLIAMVADQSPIRRERSYWTEFFNREAAFYLGAETIARATDYPVIFAQCRRRARGYYTIKFHPIASPPYPREGHELTETYVRMAEQAIREEPQSWLWSNRRWKRSQQREPA